MNRFLNRRPSLLIQMKTLYCQIFYPKEERVGDSKIALATREVQLSLPINSSAQAYYELIWTSNNRH